MPDQGNIIKRFVQQNQSGFTLVEIVIVGAIIGIASALAVPNYVQWNSKRELREAAT